MKRLTLTARSKVPFVPNYQGTNELTLPKLSAKEEAEIEKEIDTINIPCVARNSPNYRKYARSVILTRKRHPDLYDRIMDWN